MSAPTQQRLALRAGGFAPIPVFGKKPAPKEWQTYDAISDEMIEMWAKTWPDAHNTGILTKRTPAIDIDIKDENAAEAVEALVRERFEDRGRILVRIGEAPKRLIPMRTDAAFKKLRRAFIAPSGPAPDGRDPAIEILADGQHFVAFGIHPDTKQHYRWHGGEPGEVRAEDLPSLNWDEGRQFLEDATKLLVGLGYKIKRALKREGLNGKGEERSSTPEVARNPKR
jgi:putative DNA primase/helicase